MANYFQLFHKGTEDIVTFQEVDEMMCAFFNAPVDEERYYEEWYNVEGFGIACGHTWDSLRKKTPGRSDIINFLEMNFDYIAYAQK